MLRLLIIAALVAGSAWSVSGPTPHPTEDRGLASDTLVTDSIRVGDVFIRALPAEIQGRLVETYEGVRVPATGWVQDRSFFWRVPLSATGSHRFVLLARLKGGARDTVFVDLHVLR